MPGLRKLDTPYSRCVWRGWGVWLRLVRGFKRLLQTSVSSRWLSSDHCSNYTTVNSAETQQIGTVKVTCLPCATTCELHDRELWSSFDVKKGPERSRVGWWRRVGLRRRRPVLRCLSGSAIRRSRPSLLSRASRPRPAARRRPPSCRS